VQSLRLQQKQYPISFKEGSLQRSVVLSTFPSFLDQSFNAVSVVKFIPVAVLETAHHQLGNFFYSAATIHTISTYAEALKWVTYYDPNFGKVLVHM
jgi:hypothetical protein